MTTHPRQNTVRLSTSRKKQSLPSAFVGALMITSYKSKMSTSAARSRHVFLLIMMVLGGFQQLCIQAKTFDLDVERSDAPRAGDGKGKGILLFAYGSEDSTRKHYLGEAIVSARRVKALNPDVNITLVTNPGFMPDINDTFDVVMNVKAEYMLEGKVPAWKNNGIKQQWLTRLEYLARTPYEVTLALDSQALCCSSAVNDMLTQGLGGFDIAFAVQGPTTLKPHNWAIMYLVNDRTLKMFNRWRILHIAKGKSGSDQGSLHAAAGSLALQDLLSVGILSENVASSILPFGRDAPTWPKTTPLVGPGEVHFIHYAAVSHEDMEISCEKVNREGNRARVIFQAKPMPRSKSTGLRITNTWQMLYSEEELREAAHLVREGTRYFENLDWGNSLGKWGHNVTPWREHYPNCWQDLFEEVDEVMRVVLANERVQASRAFLAEFHDDKLWPLGQP